MLLNKAKVSLLLPFVAEKVEDKDETVFGLNYQRVKDKIVQATERDLDEDNNDDFHTKRHSHPSSWQGVVAKAVSEVLEKMGK